MKIEYDTIKIQMTLQEAKELKIQIKECYKHFADAVNAMGSITEEQLMTDYPAVVTLLRILEVSVKTTSKDEDLPF